MGSLAALTAITLATWSVWRPTPARAQTDAPQYPSDVRDDVPVAAVTASRPVYRYSVISGGAHNRQELRDAISRDPVVADHYRTVSLDRVRVEKLTEERRAYVSYRVGDRVYWTKHKVTLPEGERILTDGVNQIRARCGNCISYEPQLPTSDEEPDAIEFETFAPPVHETVPSRAATHGMVPFAVTPVVSATHSDLVPSLTAGIDQSSSQPFVNAPALANTIPTQRRAPKAIVPNLPLVVPVPGNPAPAGFDPEGFIPGDTILGVSFPGGSFPGGHTAAVPGNGILYTPIPGTLISQPGPGASEFGGDDPSHDAPIQPVPVPEPSTILLFGTGVAGALWRRVHLRHKR